MRRVALASAVSVLVGLAFAPLAQASPYDRWCGTSQDGWVVGPDNANNETQWIVNGPWHIQMTNGHAQAPALLKRFPVQEFDTHIPLREVPCLLAQGIATSASEKWPYWGNGAGPVHVSVGTSGGLVRLGLYHCTSKSLEAPKAAKVTCSTRFRGSSIIGVFTISDNPYYS
jgi:hypothetical protein